MSPRLLIWKLTCSQRSFWARFRETIYRVISAKWTEVMDLFEPQFLVRKALWKEES